jgi:hypothetical protein
MEENGRKNRFIFAIFAICCVGSVETIRAFADEEKTGTAGQPASPANEATYQLGGTARPTGPYSNYRLPPQRLSTTLNIDGSTTTLSLSGARYSGVRLTKVSPSGVAASAGLKPEDILLTLNERNVSSPDGADALLNKLPSGDLRFSFARKINGKFQIVESRVRYINPLRSSGSKELLLTNPEMKTK